MLPPAWIDGSEPSFLLIHGEEDTYIDPLESAAFADLLERKGVDVELKLIPSAEHDLGESSPGFDETWSAMQAFLAQLAEQLPRSKP
jgi:dipeptidyl aminopeptidase/acylaminoacyl peptidase